MSKKTKDAVKGAMIFILLGIANAAHGFLTESVDHRQEVAAFVSNPSFARASEIWLLPIGGGLLFVLVGVAFFLVYLLLVRNHNGTTNGDHPANAG